jgi:predicted transposase
MIKTIKLPYKSNYNFDKILKQYSNVVRWSFNRLKENKSQKEIRLLSKSLSNIDLLNSWFIQCAILEGQSIYNKNLDNKIIFGSKKQFYYYL